MHCAVRTDAVHASQNTDCSVRKSSRWQLRWESCFARIIWTLGGALVFGGVYCKQVAVSA